MEKNPPLFHTRPRRRVVGPVQYTSLGSSIFSLFSTVYIHRFQVIIITLVLEICGYATLTIFFIGLPWKNGFPDLSVVCTGSAALLAAGVLAGELVRFSSTYCTKKTDTADNWKFKGPMRLISIAVHVVRLLLGVMILVVVILMETLYDREIFVAVLAFLLLLSGFPIFALLWPKK